MNLETFKTHIKTVNHETLDAYFDEITGKMHRARDPQRKLGYAMALDELVIEAGNRKQGEVECSLSDDELLEQLAAG